MRRIGKGSYGDVWLARNSTGAYRAVKIVYRRAFTDVRPFEREFSGIQKFEPVSRSHEGFIDVLQVGINEDEEYFYYVMELGDDESKGLEIDPATYSPQTLSKMMRNRERLPVTECLTLALALSRALVELHNKRLVHRDVKPSNIIFVNGCPKLADIGLVAPLDEARSYVGTEGFIPPEGPGTPQADVYSLGKVLYEIATGRDRHDFPDLPNLNELPDRDAFLEFNEVIIKACNGNAQQRYQSASELHADLVVLQNGESVRRLHVLERRWIAIKRTATIATVITLIASLVGYEGYSQWRRREEARQREVGGQIAYGNAAIEAGDYLGALPHFTTALLLDKPTGAHKRIHELRIASLLQAAPKLTHLWKQKQEVLDARFSPDGKWAALSENSGHARLLDLNTDTFSKPFGSGTMSISFSPDSSLIATSEERFCNVRRVADFSRVCQLEHPRTVYSARFNATGHQLLTGCGDGIARLWDVDASKVIRKWSHDKPIRFAEISADGKFIVTCSEDHTARLWAIDGNSPLYTFQHSGWVNHAAFSPDHKKLVTGCGDHKARVWDLTTGRQLFPELTHLDSVKSAEFSPDGTLILTGSLDGSVRLWRADTLEPISADPILKNSDRVNRATFDASGQTVIIAGVDGTVRVWDFSDCWKTPPENRTIYSGDGAAVAQITEDGVRLRRGATRFFLSRTNIDRLFFSRFGSTFALRERNSHAVEVWSASQQKLIATVNTTLGNCVPDEDGTRMLGYEDQTLQLWTFAATGATNPLILPHANKIHSVAFNNGGDAVLVISGKNVLLWDVVSGKWRIQPIKFKMEAHHAEFSPDGTMIAACCADGSYAKGYGQVFSAATGKPITAPLYHTDGVLWITFSADSKRVATAGEDFNAVIWDIRTGLPVSKPIAHREKVLTAAFSPDGSMLATIAWDSTMRIWNAETGDPITPAYPCEWANKRPIFTDDGVVVTDDKRVSRFWKFPTAIPASDDLNDIATLLCGANAKSASATTQSPDARWNSLRSRYPDLFAVDAAVGANVKSTAERSGGR